ncbi:hypothetical protein HMPREF9318_00533 [Streptococcus urinalis FB127-CNA-2]|uniref:Membrane protein n=1 Tax=Streptococcus urinalis 2285-97 TaxID=764291 RepID=G5KGG8_9STRE|nr:DUF2273 domain-containing protein [Streptococcus urinalis]EHJ56755.1 putative membrane protein [Streptococcus urinalis 2285-97]EKS22335.1 hypothetical protein HMPREF9318_00533 [Streptococcus urinalis FB127-CNA-2]VEF32147.1 membrane protein [Streptococcus urinalis]
MEFFERFKYPILGGVAGLILAIMFVSFGFWKTILVLIFIGLGSYLGLYAQRTGILDNLFRNRK